MENEAEDEKADEFCVGDAAGYAVLHNVLFTLLLGDKLFNGFPESYGVGQCAPLEAHWRFCANGCGRRDFISRRNKPCLS